MRGGWSLTGLTKPSSACSISIDTLFFLDITWFEMFVKHRSNVRNLKFSMLLLDSKFNKSIRCETSLNRLVSLLWGILNSGMLKSPMNIMLLVKRVLLLVIFQQNFQACC
uniref:Uncharacterized protein n=1 Tax=Cacopsylla melanoneura TaxID=428564 RepID=A0A8D9EA10_9HEMI